jgi:hypothetical protein
LIQGEIVRLLWRLLILIALVGVLASLSSGLVENKPDFISIPENKYFGFPLVWRMLNTATGETYSYYFELAIDWLFWFALALIVTVVAIATQKSIRKSNS